MPTNVLWQNGILILEDPTDLICRAIGVKLGQGVPLEEILKSSKQVAEGVPTAGVVVGLGRRYKVSLPVLTAVAQVLNSSLRADQAVAEIMNLPQIEER